MDPSQQATKWLIEHLKDHRLEVVNQQDGNLATTVELAVRFGKTLLIQEVDKIEPFLIPLMRKELVKQGTHWTMAGII